MASHNLTQFNSGADPYIPYTQVTRRERVEHNWRADEGKGTLLQVCNALLDPFGRPMNQVHREHITIPAMISLSKFLLLILQYIPIIQLDLADMEDLTILGKAKTFCPYYAARARAQVHKALPSLPAAAAVHSF